ncbi:MAG: cyclic nucleotide-binding domain-containing protein [Spirosomaceae bacterium]|nr:cyclic nucleotide-binding domain-containing protein [Spirosomataceae bacterium]
MKTEILAYFSENWSGSKDELAEVIDALNIKTIKKGTILVQEGAVSTLCYYILKGCVRQYILEDGIEKTTAFYTENQAVVPFQTYLKGKPSNHFTVCLEDVTAIVGNPEEEKEMYRKFPNLESLTRTMIEQDFRLQVIWELRPNRLAESGVGLLRSRVELLVFFELYAFKQ